MYEDKYCQNDLNINASIVRRTLEKSNDPEVQRAEARRLWHEKEDFLKAQCPTISPEPYPAWFDKILDSSGADVPSAAPDDPNDWWDDEDWELCETGLCAEDDSPMSLHHRPPEPGRPLTAIPMRKQNTFDAVWKRQISESWDTSSVSVYSLLSNYSGVASCPSWIYSCPPILRRFHSDWLSCQFRACVQDCGLNTDPFSNTFPDWT